MSKMIEIYTCSQCTNISSIINQATQKFECMELGVGLDNPASSIHPDCPLPEAKPKCQHCGVDYGGIHAKGCRAVLEYEKKQGITR